HATIVRESDPRVDDPRLAPQPACRHVATPAVARRIQCPIRHHRAARMPSFDIVSEVDKHELTNAVDQANRELGNRFDFKGSDALFALDGYVITATAPSDFQLKQMQDILRTRLT